MCRSKMSGRRKCLTGREVHTRAFAAAVTHISTRLQGREEREAVDALCCSSGSSNPSLTFRHALTRTLSRQKQMHCCPSMDITSNYTLIFSSAVTWPPVWQHLIASSEHTLHFSLKYFIIYSSKRKKSILIKERWEIRHHLFFFFTLQVVASHFITAPQSMCVC